MTFMGHTEEHEAKHPTYTAWTYAAQSRFNQLTADGVRHCHYVPPVALDGGYYRHVIVFEDYPGYFCMGAFDKNLSRAESQASADNQRMGMSEDEATRIVSSSIRAQVALAKHPQFHRAA
jgi:hypothetical protein